MKTSEAITALSELPLSAGLTTHQLARVIRMHPGSVRRAIRQGRIRAVSFGGIYRIPTAEVNRLLASGLP